MSTAKKLGLTLGKEVKHGKQKYTLTKSDKGQTRYVLTIRACHEEANKQQS